MRKPTAKANRRRSQRQENGLAKDTGGSAQRGSGCLPWAKSDVAKVFGRFRAECKFTRAKSFSITKAIINKIRSECNFNEIPMIDVTFVTPTGRTDERWVFLPYEVWLRDHNQER